MSTAVGLGIVLYLKAEVLSKDTAVKWFDKDLLFCPKIQSLHSAAWAQ